MISVEYLGRGMYRRTRRYSSVAYKRVICSDEREREMVKRGCTPAVFIQWSRGYLHKMQARGLPTLLQKQQHDALATRPQTPGSTDTRFWALSRTVFSGLTAPWRSRVQWCLPSLLSDNGCRYIPDVLQCCFFFNSPFDYFVKLCDPKSSPFCPLGPERFGASESGQKTGLF